MTGTGSGRGGRPPGSKRGTIDLKAGQRAQPWPGPPERPTSQPAWLSGESPGVAGPPTPRGFARSPQSPGVAGSPPSPGFARSLGDPGRQAPLPPASAGPVEGDWDAIVGDLDPGEPAPSPPRLAPLPVPEPDDDPMVLVARPHAYENQDLYAYKIEPLGVRPDGLPPAEPEIPLADVPKSTGPGYDRHADRQFDWHVDRSAPSGGLTLPKPTLEPTPARPALPARLPDALPKNLFQEPTSPKTARERGLVGEGIPVQRVVGAVIVLGILLGGIGFWLTRPPPPPPTGMISVVSDPDGAEILVNGAPIGRRTPAQIFDVEVGRLMKIELEMPGYLAEPTERVVEVRSDQTTTAYFALAPVRRLRVESTPPGADVRLDGRLVKGVTPLTLPPVIVGKRMTLEVSLPEHLTETVEWVVSDDHAAVDPIVLRRAVTLSVLSEPAGATVEVDGKELGVTPLYELSVPRGDAFKLSVSRPGYAPVVRNLRLLDDRELRFTLNQVSIRKMRLSRADRAEAARLERGLKAAERRVSAARRAVEKSERYLQRLLDDPHSLFGERAKAETAVDRANTALAQAEELLFQSRADMEQFRARVLSTQEVGLDP